MLKNNLFWSAAVTGLVLDQFTKYLVLQNFPEIGYSIPILNNVFHLTYVTNTGAAFSLFSNSGGWLRWLSLLVSLFLVFLGANANLQKIEQLGYGCILAGAAGNGIDRFFAGHVIDFLDFQLINFPVFNFADVFINIGLIFILINIFQDTAREKKEDK